MPVSAQVISSRGPGLGCCCCCGQVYFLSRLTTTRDSRVSGFPYGEKQGSECSFRASKLLARSAHRAGAGVARFRCSDDSTAVTWNLLITPVARSIPASGASFPALLRRRWRASAAQPIGGGGRFWRLALSISGRLAPQMCCSKRQWRSASPGSAALAPLGTSPPDDTSTSPRELPCCSMQPSRHGGIARLSLLGSYQRPSLLRFGRLLDQCSRTAASRFANIDCPVSILMRW